MKKILSLFLMITIISCLCSCGDSGSAVAECEDLINQIGDISTFGLVDTHAEVTFIDSGILAYEAAVTSYTALSDKEKQQVDNAYILEEKRNDYETAKSLFAQYVLESEIMLESKEYLVTYIKDRMKDPNSYEEVDFSVHRPHDYKETGEFTIHVTLIYSGTNSFGGRIQEEISAFVKGLYHDDEFEIKNVLTF